MAYLVCVKDKNSALFAFCKWTLARVTIVDDGRTYNAVQLKPKVINANQRLGNLLQE